MGRDVKMETASIGEPVWLFLAFAFLAANAERGIGSIASVGYRRFPGIMPRLCVTRWCAMRCQEHRLRVRQPIC